MREITLRENKQTNKLKSIEINVEKLGFMKKNFVLETQLGK